MTTICFFHDYYHQNPAELDQRLKEVTADTLRHDRLGNVLYNIHGLGQAFRSGGHMGNQDNKFPKIPEKRHYERIEMELPVEIEVDGKKVSASTENVSCGGMFLPNLAGEYREDQDVIAFVNLPGRPAMVRLSARVSRVEETEEAGGRNGVALQFDGLYDDNRLEIDRYIKWKLLH